MPLPPSIIRRVVGPWPPAVECVRLEVLHEAAELQRLWQIAVFAGGRHELAHMPTFESFASVINTVPPSEGFAEATHATIP